MAIAVPQYLPLRAGQQRPEQIPPGGCDVYEGEQGTLYVCCKSADDSHIDCYKAVIHHQDPWGPSLPSPSDLNRLVANGQVTRIDPRQLGLTTTRIAGRNCTIVSNYTGQLYICCSGNCVPLPITVGELPVPARKPLQLHSRGGTSGTPGCHVVALGPMSQLYMCCDDVCVPLPIVFGPLPAVNDTGSLALNFQKVRRRRRALTGG